MTTDIQLYRPDTGEFPPVRLVDGHTAVSAPYSRAEGIAALHEIEQYAAATIDRIYGAAKRGLWRALEEAQAEAFKGARLPKQWPEPRHEQRLRRWEHLRVLASFAELPDQPGPGQKQVGPEPGVQPTATPPPKPMPPEPDVQPASLIPTEPPRRVTDVQRVNTGMCRVNAIAARDATLKALVEHNRPLGWKPDPADYGPHPAEPDHGRIDRWLQRVDARLRQTRFGRWLAERFTPVKEEQ